MNSIEKELMAIRDKELEGPRIHIKYRKNFRCFRYYFLVLRRLVD